MYLTDITAFDFSTEYRIDTEEGNLVGDSTESAATEFFYEVEREDQILITGDDYQYQILFYRAEREERYLYSYDYPKESALVVFDALKARLKNRGESYTFFEKGYIRILASRRDNQSISSKEAGKIAAQITFHHLKRDYVSKKCFQIEISDTIHEVNKVLNEQKCVNGVTKILNEQKRAKAILSLCVLTDSHYAVNGTWEDTADNLTRVVQHCQTDAVLHLGDFTDGSTSKKVTREYVRRMLADLQNLKDVRGYEVPLYITPGNHDANYFKRNKEPLDMEQQLKMFGMKQSYYYVDFEETKIRCIFLDSYDIGTPVRYGFSDEELKWLKETLDSVRSGNKVLLFSHEAPLPELDYWAHLIRNGENLMTILEEYNSREACQILGYIHGHTHAEQIWRKSSFPIISIGCNKCEYYLDKKPKESMTYHRAPDTVTQDLWDMLLADSDGETLTFVRFGAGNNRVIDCRKTPVTWRKEEEERRKNRMPKIYADRGASSFAPENSIPALQTAKNLNIDGIVIDVRLTKDKVPVLIRDSSIERVSDGTGLVNEMTVEELKKYNFGCHKRTFGFVSVTTLLEALDVFHATDYRIMLILHGNASEIEILKEKTNREIMEMTKVSYLSAHPEIQLIEENEEERFMEEMKDTIIVTTHPGTVRDER